MNVDALRSSVKPMGDRALRCARPPEANGRALFDRLRAVPDVVDVVITEEHVLIVFARSPSWEAVAPAFALASTSAAPKTREHRIHVRYDGEDLPALAAQLGMATDALIAIHRAGRYEVKTIGFVPGFAYLGDLDARLQAPRRDTPRLRVPRHSVAVAGPYTAVYPFPSSGGWHLIGTAVDFVPFELALGDHVRFEVSS